MNKLFLLVAALCLLSNEGISQDYKNEIGVNIFKLNEQIVHGNTQFDYRVQIGFKEYDPHNSYDYNEYKTFVSPHIFYKTRLFRNINFRSEFQFLNRISNRSTYTILTNPIIASISGSQTIRTNRYYLASGLQYSFWSNRKLYPYLFGIGTGNLISSKIERYNVDGQFKDEEEYDPELKLGYTFGIGAQYRFSKRFSSSLELSENSSYESHLLSRLSINYHF